MLEQNSETGKLSITLADPRPTLVAEVRALPDTETQALLARLEPLPEIAGPTPAIRAPSAPPPRTGVVTPIALVPMTGAAIPDAPPSAGTRAPNPLDAPQILPTGEASAASEVVLRFAEPMVAVAAVGAVATPSATITPAVAGSWRWIDTRVAKFTAATTFPAATTFTVTVAAGTRALSGGALAAATTGTFSTPPVQIARVFPRLPVRVDEPLLIEFDQPVDAAIAKFVRIERLGKPLAFQPVSLDRAKELWARDPRIDLATTKFPPHFVILAPKTAWPASIPGRDQIEASIVLGKGAPSLEGPRVTAKESAGLFTIAAPFALLGLTCGDVEKPRFGNLICPARGRLDVKLSNGVVRRGYRDGQIQIDGQPIDKESKPYSGTMMFTVPNVVGGSFSVSVAADLVDELGQPLTGARRAAFTTTRARYQKSIEANTGLYILDPRYEIPQWSITVQAVPSLHVELYRVEPTDYFAFQAFEGRKRSTPPGKRVYDKLFTVGDRFAGTARIDLRPALGTGGIGHVIAVATPSGSNNEIQRQTAWIQVSKLGVTARFDTERVHAWVHQLVQDHFLEPTAATTSLVVDGRPDRQTASTDAEGHASFELFEPKVQPPNVTLNRRTPEAMLLVTTSTDSVFASIDRNTKTVRRNDARWYVTDDRFTYKPGETVYVKGWVRWTHSGVNPDIALPGSGETVTYTLSDAKNAKLGGGTAQLSPQGGFDLEIALPANANLGTAVFSLDTRGDTMTHAISIEEFRTPTYAVALADDVAFGGTTPLIVGESIEMTASAKYYSGGGLGGARIKWSAALRPASYEPPGWDDYSFATLSEGRYYNRRYRRGTSESEYSTLSGASSSTAQIGVPALPSNEPSVLVVDATVTDIDRATIRDSSRAIIVHPSAYYVGIRQRSDTGPRDELELVVTDIDGTPAPKVAIDVVIEGVSGRDRDDESKVIDTQHCTLTSTGAPVICGWKRKDRDTAYSAVARIADSRGRTNAARYYIPWYSTQSSESDLQVIPDKVLYRPGDVAKLDIRSAIVPSTAIVSFARQGVIAQRRVALTKLSTTIELPIEASFMRNVHVVVDRWGPRYRNRTLPEHVSVETELKLDPDFGRLQMIARPTRKSVEPGSEATFEVLVRHRGKPVAGAEVALIVVDEAVLALSDRTHADPLAPFYFDVSAGTSGMSSLSMVLDETSHLADKPGFDRIDLDDPAYAAYGVGGGRGGMRGRTASVPSVSIGAAAAAKTRKDFRPTAVFSPRLITDENGRVAVTVKMPDSLTRFRVLGLATANTRYFGKAEGMIFTQRAINARMTAPRFLSQGDAFSLPVVVQNLDGKPRTIDVAVRAANLIATGPAGKRVTIPAGQRAELRFEFRTATRGRAVLQSVASSTGFVDATQIEIPVYEPTTTESFATYGTVDDDKPAFERIEVPKDLVTDVGGVETELSATQMTSLTDAFWYVQDYPFECAEQRSSRMLANASVIGVLELFSAPDRPSRADLDATRARDLRMLEHDQNSDGGWGYFGNLRSDPFVSQQVLAALLAVKAEGDPGMRSKTVTQATAFVTKNVTDRIARLESLAKQPVARRSGKEVGQLPFEIALAAAELGTVERRIELALRVHAVASSLGVYPLDAKARILAVLAKHPRGAAVRKELTPQLLSTVREDAGRATVTSSYAEGERLLLVSNAKTSALVLDALIRELPEHTLIPKLARGLLESRRRGRWQTTQENVAVLQVMARYFDTYEKTPPSFTGKVWIGTAGYAEQVFDRRDTHAAVKLGWAQLVGPTHDLSLARAGAGRLYYRIGITYAPKLHPTPVDAGFIVRRSYSGLEDPSDVTRLPDGSYKVKLGAAVLVELEVLNAAQRHAVALVDPLPAGFEPVNGGLAHAERVTIDTGNWDHTNLRNERSEAFSMELSAGNHHFSYVARATTPGRFAAAPAKAEEMYAPETFGRTAGSVVVVE